MKIMKKMMKRNPGFTLVEALMALIVLSIVVPASLGALGTVFTADFKINETARVVSSAEWWFSRLTLPVRMDDIDAAPKTDPHGTVYFRWDTENLPYGAIKVTLRAYGRVSGSAFVVSRIL